VALSALSIGFVVVGRAVRPGLARPHYAERVPRTRLAANNTVTQGATPLGALLGGAVASYQSLDGAWWLAVLVMALPLIAMLASPLRAMRTLAARVGAPLTARTAPPACGRSRSPSPTRPL